MKAFPLLYKRTRTGAIQVWWIEVYGNEIRTHWGQQGGAEQTALETIREGKNLGKKNETTPEQQAELEAQSRWNKQVKDGYVEDLSKAAAGEDDRAGIKCMLAEKFEDFGDRIIYPAYVQPKLDGHRCIAILMAGKCTLWSRSRDPILSMPHICAEIEELFGYSEFPLYFDGELYIHGEEFRKISSMIRKREPRPGHERMQYWMYDLPHPTETFEQRWDSLFHMYMYSEAPANHVQLVPTQEITSEDQLLEIFNGHIAAKYEGTMVRNMSGKYVYGSRSKDLLKLKEFDDDEFKVIDVIDGAGKYEGIAVLVCETADGKPFNCTYNAPMKECAHIFANKEQFIGKLLTVRYQGFTEKENVPRIPKGKAFRD